MPTTSPPTTSSSYLAAPDDQKRFVHGVEWARGGADKIMLSGGETNFEPTCGDTNGAFATFRVRGGASRPTFTFADQVRPLAGNYLDGNPPQGTYHLGCSVHWFEPQPDFHDEGLVALASYENGTRFERIARDGSITEVGFFEPLGGATSAPHWAPDGRLRNRLPARDRRPALERPTLRGEVDRNGLAVRSGTARRRRRAI